MLLAVLLVILAFTHPVRVAILTVAVLPSTIPSLPFDPLVSLTPKPIRETFAFDYPAGTVEGYVYSPGRGGRHGAIILILGARPVDRDDPVLTHFAEGLSRAGLVVMIPVSSGLAAGRIVPEETDAVIEDVELLRGRADVDPSRIGVIGLSVGGSVAIQAAADPRLDGKLAVLNVFGSYYDAIDVVRAVATRSLAYAGLDEPWTPDALAFWVIARQMVDTLPDPHDREVLDRLYLQSDQSARGEVGAMTPVGRAALRLLDGASPAEAEAALAQLPPATIARLQGVSPARTMAGLRTPLFVMHDQGDHFVPYTESRLLAEHAPSAVLQRFSELNMFDHVMPNRAPTDAEFYLELLRLLRHLYGVLLYVL